MSFQNEGSSNYLFKQQPSTGSQSGSILSCQIIEQTKYGVCKLNLPNGEQATAFFSVIDCDTRVRRGLFTCNHVINANYLQSENCVFSVSNDSKSRQYQVEGFWFTDEQLDATFIELSEKQAEEIFNLNYRFLQMDYKVVQGDSIYLFQHPGDESLKFATGSVMQLAENGNGFYHNACTDEGSSGSPVVNRHGEVIGMHRGLDKTTDVPMKYAVKVRAIRDAVIRKIQRIDEPQKQRRTRFDSGDDNKRYLFREKSAAGAQSARQCDLILCIGGYPNDCSQQILVSSVHTGNWCIANTLNHDRNYASAVFWKGTVIISGSTCWPTNSVEQYDPQSNSFLQFPNLLVGRCDHAMVDLEGTMFAIGGNSGCLNNGEFDNSMVLSSVEIFNDENYEWQAAFSFKNARAGLAATALQGCILIAGGFDGDYILSSCEWYDSYQQRWSFAASLNKARSHAATVTHNNKVYIFGGGNDWNDLFDDAEQYDRQSDCWTLLNKRMSVARCAFAAATVGNQVYLLGGRKSETESVDLVESFNFVTNNFTVLQPLPSPRFGLTAVAIRASNAAFDRMTHSSDH